MDGIEMQNNNKSKVIEIYSHASGRWQSLYDLMIDDILYKCGDYYFRKIDNHDHIQEAIREGKKLEYFMESLNEWVEFTPNENQHFVNYKHYRVKQ